MPLQVRSAKEKGAKVWPAGVLVVHVVTVSLISCLDHGLPQERLRGLIGFCWPGGLGQMSNVRCLLKNSSLRNCI